MVHQQIFVHLGHLIGDRLTDEDCAPGNPIFQGGWAARVQLARSVVLFS
jgi:hypothetical protein